MSIPERFAGRPDGSEWRAELATQPEYDELRQRLTAWAADYLTPMCDRNWYCILRRGHPPNCLALMVLTNIPRDPTLPPES